MLNLPTPVFPDRNAESVDRYLRIIHAAWEITFGPLPMAVGQGVVLDALRARLEPVLRREVPPRTTRRFDAFPETVAGFVSMCRKPRYEPGFYLIVDMGAGTTELSVNHVNFGQSSIEQRVWTYAHRSIRLGGNDYHDAGDDLARGGALNDRLRHEIRGIWYRGCQQDMNGGRVAREQWKRITTLIAGCGLRRAGLVEIVYQIIPQVRVFIVHRD